MQFSYRYFNYIGLLCWGISAFFACDKLRKSAPGEHKNKAENEHMLIQDWIKRDSANEYNKYFDVRHYALEVELNPRNKSISGKVKIDYRTLRALDLLQLDLQAPLQIDSIKVLKSWGEGQILDFTRIREKVLVRLANRSIVGKKESIVVYYHGQPRETTHGPWESGVIWQKDSLGRDFIGVACQHLGGSLWFPCKDLWGDKADEGVDMRLVLPRELTGVANGEFQGVEEVDSLHKAYKFHYTLPISTYNITFYAGFFTHWREDFAGLKGNIPLEYYVLDYHKKQASLQFAQVPDILRAFEYWLGAYPFYGMPLNYVESPYLGMEHQGAIAYGNGYKNGYAGRDLSTSGYGLFWDFILVHETAHQWFGNRVSAVSARDMWIQESFADYAEALFTEYTMGKKAALSYEAGKRQLVKNKVPVITDSLRFDAGTDMYFKGGNMLQTLRTYLNNDEQFRAMLNQATANFSQAINSEQFLHWIQQYLHKDLQSFFHYYLYTKKPPILQYKLLPEEHKILFRYARVEKDFTLPITFAGRLIRPQRSGWISVDLGDKFILYPRYLDELYLHYYFQFMEVKDEPNVDKDNKDSLGK